MPQTYLFFINKTLWVCEIQRAFLRLKQKNQPNKDRLSQTELIPNLNISNLNQPNLTTPHKIKLFSTNLHQTKPNRTIPNLTNSNLSKHNLPEPKKKHVKLSRTEHIRT